MFTKDDMVSPKESAHFRGQDANGNVMELQDMDFYKDDYIGLK